VTSGSWSRAQVASGSRVRRRCAFVDIGPERDGRLAAGG
jgi:hypothetical protein